MFFDDVSWTHKKATVTLCSSYTERQRLLRSPRVVLQLGLIFHYQITRIDHNN